MKTEYIVGIGEILWDMLPEGRRLGGAPANFAYHVSQFGLKSVVVSAVGRDEAGDAWKPCQLIHFRILSLIGQMGAGIQRNQGCR